MLKTELRAEIRSVARNEKRLPVIVLGQESCATLLAELEELDALRAQSRVRIRTTVRNSPSSYVAVGQIHDTIVYEVKTESDDPSGCADLKKMTIGPMQAKSLRGTDAGLPNSKERPAPIPDRLSYATGLTRLVFKQLNKFGVSNSFVDQQCRAMCIAGRQTDAIKYVRDTAQIGLKEAKEYVDILRGF